MSSTDALRAIFNEFSTLPDEPLDVSPWLERLAASTGLADVYGEAGADGARAFARALDAAEPLGATRREFHIPTAGAQATEAVYLTGHSLGLQPTSTAAAVKVELDKWAARGVAGHFEGALPWASCEEAVVELLGELVGAKNAKLEVAAMNSLTVNLHFLMAAFYRPTATRAAILIEAGAFPSDRYAVASQVRAAAPLPLSAQRTRSHRQSPCYFSFTPPPGPFTDAALHLAHSRVRVNLNPCGVCVSGVW